MVPTGPPAAHARCDRPPPLAFLGFGAALFAINHLSVAVGNGLMPEAVVMGCWLVIMTAWALLAGRTFDAAWGRVNRPRRPVGWALALATLTLAAAVAAGEGVARLVYGQPLLG